MSKLNFFSFFLFLLTFVNCQSEIKNSTKDYVIVNDDGVYVEKFDSTNFDENKYNHNNIIYKVGSSLKYKFEHLTRKGKVKFFARQKFSGLWEFVDFEKADSNTVQSLVITVLNGNPMSASIPDYNQTVISFEIGNDIRTSRSGVIENEENVWMHPPGVDYFKILKINPFPFIKAPYEIGTKWKWNMAIGDHWADERWKSWKGQIENNYKYEIVDTCTVKTVFGRIECFVVEAKADSRIGKTELKAFFSATFGFVKLNYVNIDGSKTNLELIEFKKAKK